MNSESPVIVLVLLPTLRISGGVREAIRLASDLRRQGIDARILSIWRHWHELTVSDVPVSYLSAKRPRKAWAIFDLMVSLVRYRRVIRRLEGEASVRVILTHYSTLPFGSFSPSESRFCLVQDLEWHFLRRGLSQWILRKYILHAYAGCSLITVGPYLSRKLSEFGLHRSAVVNIWAEPAFAAVPDSAERAIDVAMVLRHGAAKRLDMYLQLLQLLATEPPLRCAVATPEDDIAQKVSHLSRVCLLRPSRREICELFRQSRTFVLLSEHEGFALPPLEAMGTGCIPICRDAGGIRDYMHGPLSRNLVPLDEPLESIARRLRDLVDAAAQNDKLSAEVRMHFEQGLILSMEMRKRALEVLAQRLSLTRTI